MFYSPNIPHRIGKGPVGKVFQYFLKSCFQSVERDEEKSYTNMAPKSIN